MRRFLLVPFVALAACRSDAPAEPEVEPPVVLPPEACVAAPLDDPRNIPACSTGSGAFGRWTTDDLGLPAYDYLVDQAVEPLSLYPNTEDRERRDHWHQLGNRRITAIFTNDGSAAVLTQDRGPTWLNVIDPDQRAYGGGFSYLDDGEAQWVTAYAQRPHPSKTTRRFGAAYAETTLEHRSIRVHRTLAAPPGDAPMLVDQVVLENTGATARTVRHYEYWDVGRRQLRTSWLASGIASKTVPPSLAAQRDALNAYFDETPSWDPARKMLRVVRARSAAGAAVLPADDAPSDLDARPGDPFLVALTGEVVEAWTDQEAFFGAGDVKMPDAVAGRHKGAVSGPRNGKGQPHLFVLASDVTLAPGEKKTLSFAYGYARMGEAPVVPPGLATLDVRRAAVDAIRDQLAYFSSDREPWLTREMAWHGAYLQGSVCYREYWDRHVVPQGSAYLYLHGADGAARDQALFSLPLVYTDPALAREQLLFLMGLTHDKDARMSYAFQGHGVLDDALIHTAPSDLYLFFLLAMTEYLQATGDASVLDELVDFHPRSPTSKASGFEHVRRGVRHLFDVIGTGRHGLLRVQTGDWSDGIVASEAKNRDKAVAEGESVPNTQMAAWVLPRAADWIEARDPALAKELRDRAVSLRTAAETTWTGTHYYRAWLDQTVPYGESSMTLEAQVWALVAGMPHGAELTTNLEARLHTTRVGPLMFEPPPGSPKKGDVWPAIADLLVWGYAESARDDLAWKTFTEVTLGARAQAFPGMWAGIWSAADGQYADEGGAAPGAAWASVVTPMLDFPIMNANAHAMPLLALLRLCGLTPIAGGLRVAPHVPGRMYTLDTKLVRLEVRGSSIVVEYRPIADASRTLEIELGQPIAGATLDGAAIPVDAGATRVRSTFAAKKGTPVRLVVRGG